MVDVGLTENIGDSGLKFEIWYRRWKKGKAGESFILTVGDDRAIMFLIKFMFSVCKNFRDRLRILLLISSEFWRRFLIHLHGFFMMTHV